MRELFNMKNLAKPLAHVVLIAVLGLAVYSNTLHAPFQWDEEEFMQENPIVEDLGYFREPSRAEGLKYYHALRTRYVGYLTFSLNHRLHGWDVEGYHAFNIAVHLLAALTAYLLVLLTLRTPFFAERTEGRRIAERGRWAALAAGLLFVAHPVQTEAVTYVFQRFASLAALFYLVSITAYAASRLSGGKASRYAFYAVSVAAAVLAMKTKENAFTLPLAISLYEFLFFTGRARPRLLRLVPILMTLPVIPLASGVQAGDIAGGLDEITRGLRTVERSEYFISQLRVGATYLRLLFLPVNQNVDYAYPFFSSFLEAPVALSAVLHLALLGLGVWLVRRSKAAPLMRLAAFGIFWFYLSLSVESGIVPLPMLICEYRLYLPSTGAFAAVAAAGLHIFDSGGSGKSRAIAAFSVLLIIAFSSAAYARNGLWNSRIALWEDTVRKSPGKLRPQFNLGHYLLRSGQPEKAIEELRTALEINPEVARTHLDLGLAYKAKGLPYTAIAHYERAIELDPELAEAHNNLGASYGSLGQVERATGHIRRAIELDPELAEAYNNLGAAYGSQGRLEEAVEQFLAAVRLDPGYAEAHKNLGLAYRKMGLMGKAAAHFKRADELKSSNSKN